MATDKKFSDWLTSLPVAQVAVGDLLPIVQGGVSKQAQAGTHIPILDSSGKLAASDAYLYRGFVAFNGVDWDTLTTAGIYKTTDSGTGGLNQPPASYKYGHLIIHATDDGGVTQIYVPHNDSDPYVYVRILYAGGGVFTSWKTLGAYYGSNANGEYVRFADGTQICWSPNFTASADSGTQTWQGLTIYYHTTAWAFPAAFIATPDVYVGGNQANFPDLGRKAYNITPTGCNLAFSSLDSFAANNIEFRFGLAIGRWK